MAYTRIRYQVAQEQCEPLTSALEQLHALAVSIENDGDLPHFDAVGSGEPQWQQVTVTGLFPDTVDPVAIHRALSQGQTAVVATDSAPQIDGLAEQDWQRAFMAQVEPIQLAPQLWICPSWTTPPDPQATNIVLDPGLAFGTGAHATTALCLQWLAQADLAGKTVLDYGCGSGVLALAAAKLGAGRVVALDIDPHALRATRDNAERNGVSGDCIQVVAPSELEYELQVDVLLANILAGTLLALAPDLNRRVVANGTILLAGILKSQLAQVRRAYAQAFDITCSYREEWCLLVGKKRPGGVYVREHNA